MKKERKSIEFAQMDSLFYPGYTERWEVYDEHAVRGYGFVMSCRIGKYDKHDNWLEYDKDFGETYELYINSKSDNTFMAIRYGYLWSKAREALHELGFTNMNIKGAE